MYVRITCEIVIGRWTWGYDKTFRVQAGSRGQTGRIFGRET
jgi:hypothetical protein